MKKETTAIRHLYVHVPFCREKCAYCDFASIRADRKLRYRYLRALRNEIEKAAPRLRPETIYIGGGTPSSLPDREARHLFKSLECLDLSRLKEFTIEANPESVDEIRLALYRKRGVNRLSIGVQSFDNRILRFLGRIHDAKRARRAICLAKKTGFENFSIDLIFGVPGTDMSYWKRTLDAALELEAPHVALYGLTYERGTPLSKMLRLGKINPVDEETELGMYRLAIRTLKRASYRHYEISNFAKPGFESAHNRAYWHYKPFMGAGPSAASFDGARRWSNVRSVTGYCERVESDKSPRGRSERLTGRRRAGEVLMLGLRETHGITEKEFAALTGMDLKKDYGRRLRTYRDMGLVSWSRGRLKFTARGMEVADTILAELVESV